MKLTDFHCFSCFLRNIITHYKEGFKVVNKEKMIIITFYQSSFLVWISLFYWIKLSFRLWFTCYELSNRLIRKLKIIKYYGRSYGIQRFFHLLIFYTSWKSIVLVGTQDSFIDYINKNYRLCNGNGHIATQVQKTTNLWMICPDVGHLCHMI